MSNEELDHPCKDVCSGWKQGYERGLAAQSSKPSYDKSFCPCGGIILADTEDCKVPVCIECCVEISKSYLNMDDNYNEGFARGMEASKPEWPSKKELENWYSIWRSTHKGSEGWSSFNAIEAYQEFLKQRMNQNEKGAR